MAGSTDIIASLPHELHQEQGRGGGKRVLPVVEVGRGRSKVRVGRRVVA